MACSRAKCNFYFLFYFPYKLPKDKWKYRKRLSCEALSLRIWDLKNDCLSEKSCYLRCDVWTTFVPLEQQPAQNVPSTLQHLTKTMMIVVNQNKPVPSAHANRIGIQKLGNNYPALERATRDRIIRKPGNQRSNKVHKVLRAIIQF